MRRRTAATSIHKKTTVTRWDDISCLVGRCIMARIIIFSTLWEIALKDWGQDQNTGSIQPVSAGESSAVIVGDGNCVGGVSHRLRLTREIGKTLPKPGFRMQNGSLNGKVVILVFLLACIVQLPRSAAQDEQLANLEK